MRRPAVLRAVGHRPAPASVGRPAVVGAATLSAVRPVERRIVSRASLISDARRTDAGKTFAVAGVVSRARHLRAALRVLRYSLRKAQHFGFAGTPTGTPNP